MNLTEGMLHATNRFYEAAAGNDDLPEVLGELADLMGADCTVVEVHDRATGVPVMTENARIDMSRMSAYVDEYARVSPRVRYGRSPGALPVSHDALILSEREMDRDPYYADFLAPMGLRYFLSIAVDPDPDRFGILSFQYRPSRGPVEAPAVRMASALRPHIRRAIQGMWRRRNLTNVKWVKSDLRRRFGLTDAEAKLAIAISRGERLRDHAESRGIAMTTLHTHYDRLKHKAGCGRQAELVALLQRLYRTDIPDDWNG